MAHSPADWDEEFVLSLPQGETIGLKERSSVLDLNAGANEGHVRDELAKQLSAFANTGGGQIIYGLTDDGKVENGGIGQSVRNSAKDWLEDIIPGFCSGPLQLVP